MKFANTIFQIAKLRFSSIFDKFPEFSNNSQGTSLKARGLKFWILALYIHIYAPVKIDLAKSTYEGDFRGGDVCAPPCVISSKKKPALTRVKR